MITPSSLSSLPNGNDGPRAPCGSGTRASNHQNVSSTDRYAKPRGWRGDNVGEAPRDSRRGSDAVDRRIRSQGCGQSAGGCSRPSSP